MIDQDQFFEKRKKCFYIWSRGVCTKYQVCIVFRLVRGLHTKKHAPKYLRVKMRMFPTACSPPVILKIVVVCKKRIIKSYNCSRYIVTRSQKYSTFNHFFKIFNRKIDPAPPLVLIFIGVCVVDEVFLNFQPVFLNILNTWQPRKNEPD